MDARTLADLEATVRVRLDDQGLSKPRFPSADIAKALSEAEREACVRAHLIIEEDDEELVRINTVAGTARYDLDPCFYQIDRIVHGDTGEVLDETHEDALDRLSRRWSQQSGRPDEYVVKAAPNEQLRILLVPKPNTPGVLLLRGYRYPRAEMESADDEPEIAPVHHEALVDFACYRLLMAKDADKYDPVKAREFLDVFTGHFGERPTAAQRRARRERRRPTTVSSGAL